MKTDLWGEPIAIRRRSYSLAALFRSITLAALLFGVISWRNVSPPVVTALLATIAAMLAGIVAIRQPGGWRAKLLATIGFYFGFMLVGQYSAGVVWFFLSRDSDGLGQVFGGCWSVTVLPAIAIIAALLFRGWVSLAIISAEKPHQEP